LPHFLEEIVKVPLVMGRDWHAVGDLVDDVQLLEWTTHWSVHAYNSQDTHTCHGTHIWLYKYVHVLNARLILCFMSPAHLRVNTKAGTFNQQEMLLHFGVTCKPVC